MADYPNWLLLIVADLEDYEDTRPRDHNGYGLACFAAALELVPSEVRSMARGYAQAKREVTDGTA